ncbi:transglutaminase [Alteromonas sp. V450]|uniref:transglutaminase-like cysteine peptidase n=1 Tax=Alteromonas sp. V450 TaxID=1912139 RepID=UPI0008FF6414|nr:transglutaminase-like cysteine peptidase [Alteromonas sp. V450]OJF67693.1 transglutaminase [Alteromonas sp. V450]
MFRILSSIFVLLFVNASQSALLINEKLMNFVRIEYGVKAFNRATSLEMLLASTNYEPIDDQLYEINNFFNEIPYYTDKEHWGQSDYWATPVEMLGTNGGDCEDYVIAKYFSLRALGIPDSKMRMMFVTALRQNQAHMVLAYYPEPNAIPLILDNINPRILPANKRPDLRPVYSFNGEGLYKAKAEGRGTKLGNSRHKMWDDLTSRIEREF